MRGGNISQVFFQRAHIRVYRHIIVVEDNEHIGPADTCMVQRLKWQTRGHSAITYNSDMATMVFTLVLGSDGHTQRRRYRCRRVPYAKCIVNAFTTFRKPADAAILPVGMKNFAPAGKYFVSISLVAYVPYQLIVWSIKYIMQCHGKLHHPEAGAKMPAMNAHAIYNELSQFVTHLLQLVFIQLSQVIRGIYLAQQWSCSYFFHVLYW